MRKKNNKNIIVVIAIVIALAVILTQLGAFKLLAISQISGGTVLGVSYLQFFSSSQQLNGASAFLVNLLINNGGQSLQGTAGSKYSTTSGALSKNINDYSGTNYNVSNVNQPITINSNLNSLSLNIPYDYAGYHVYKYAYNNKFLSYSLPNAPFGLTCSSSEAQNSSNDYNIYIACVDLSNPSAILDTLSSFTSILASDCSGQYTNGLLTITNVTNGFTLQCQQPYQYEIGTAFESGTANYNYNVSIVFSNTTFIKTLFLTNQNPQTNYNNILYAQIYGFDTTGQGIATQPAPTLVEYSPSNYTFVNYLTTSSGLGQAYTQYTPAFEPITASSLNLAPSTQAGPSAVVYPLNELQNQIYQSNKKVEDILTPIQPTNPYYGMTLSHNTTGILNVINNPPVYPLAQLIAKVSTLGVYVAVSQPKIVSVNPNPFQVRDGSESTATFTISNAGTQGNAYITGSCGTSQFSTPQFNVPTSGTVESVNIQSPYNPNNATLSIPCTATIFSAFGIYNSTFNFNGQVSALCSSGSIYQNNNNCTNAFNGGNTTTGCGTGYQENSAGQCVIIPPICSANETANYSTLPPHCNGGGNSNISFWSYLYLTIIVFIIIMAIVLTRNRGGGQSPRRRYYYR
jgi:hypothetical protein